MKTWIIAALLGIAATQAQAGFFDGNKLYAYITGSNALERQQAVGYVMGVVDAGAAPGETKHGWCFELPRGITGDQAVDIVKLYLEKDPARREFGASGLAEAALQDAFPCQK